MYDLSFAPDRTTRMTNERRLGRGLGSLLGSTTGATPDADAPTERRPGAPPRARADRAASEPSDAPSAAQGIGREIEVAAIRRNADQPRTTFDSEALEELRSSIERHGVLQPVTVRRSGAGYELIAGERRWRAARAAGLATVPAIVRDDVDDGVSLELAIVENVQRQDLDALEKARGYRALMERVGLSHGEVAERVGVSRSAVSNHLRLLELPDDAQEALSEGLISMGHARALLGISDEKQLLQALSQVVRKELSVRETESLARTGDTAATAKTSAKAGATESGPSKPAWAGELERRLREVLGVRVTLRNGPKYRGSIQLDYANREELERICDLIAPKDEV